MKVEDVMSVNPVWVSPGEFVTKARELMAQAGVAFEYTSLPDAAHAMQTEPSRSRAQAPMREKAS